jgi:hypothetical protein
MEREEYLKLCQKCAVFPKRLGGIINNIPTDLTVFYLGKRYYPMKYELSFNQEGKPCHMAILHDLYTNSIVYAILEKVEMTDEQTRSICVD